MATLSTLVSFTGFDGDYPYAGLIADADGDLFGTTNSGGADGDGTVFEIAKTSTGYASAPTTLVSFDGSDGQFPEAGLIADAQGDLFGTTVGGGADNDGTVFEIAKISTGYASAPTTLVSFDGSDGQWPEAGLIVDAQGDLFGTTYYGGADGDGTVFEIAKTSTGYASGPTTLVSFDGSDGENPTAGLIADAEGDLFGTTNQGYGTVFEIAKTSTGYASAPTTLVSFDGSDGEDPTAGLIVDANGDLFGTTYQGGAFGGGTVFEIVKTSTGYASAPTTLVSFDGSDGEFPLAGLIVDANGDLFGTTYEGGVANDGTAFEIKKTSAGYASAPTLLASFDGSDGELPLAGLIADANGDLFGTTYHGGADGAGTAFEINGAGFVPPPVLTAGTSTSYVAGAAPVTLDAGLTVSDTEAVSLTGATVSISAGFLPGDALSVGSPQAGITSDYNAATGVLTLSGAASLAAYQTELDSVAFACLNASDPSRTITWSANTGFATSTPVNSSVSVSFVGNPDLDLTLQNTDGQLALWQVNGATLTATDLLGPEPASSWFEGAVGAFFSGDSSDILWQNNDGAVAVWQVRNAAFLSGAVVANPGPSWHIRGTGDFYNDGKTDILWQNDNGKVALWELNGAAIAKSGAVSANPGPSWHIEGTGDFYNDGHTDVLWQNDNGSVALWELNGVSIAKGGPVSVNPGPSWRIKGTGDFYGDGKTDILWQNDNGKLAIWEMNGITISQAGVVSVNPGPSWHVVGTGDFNQDGKTDIVFQNDNGKVAVWDMNGTTMVGGAVIADPGQAWSVSGDGAMRFIQSGSAGEILGATPTTPEEFVFTNAATGAHTIAGFNPVQDLIELPLAQFGSFAAVQEATSAFAGGAEINLGHGSALLLPGVNPAALHASNFALA